VSERDQLPSSPEGEDSAWDVAVSTDSPAHYRPDIEGLRAVAILAVVAYHARIPGTGGGFIGVDVFFVISGFLITGLLLREVTATGRLNLPGFYARRARRLLPAALVVIVVTLAMSAVILSPLRVPGVALDGAASSLYVSNYRYALVATDYFAADTEPSPLLHFWSLAVEEQFYLVWPVLILAAAKVLPRRRIWIVVGLVAAGSFALSVVVTDVNAPWAFYSLPTRAWQLALGALVALGILALPARRPDWLGAALSWIGLAMIGVAVVIVDGSTPYPGFIALLPAAGAALCIIGGDRQGVLPARLLATGPPRWFGRISYSLYLWHWPILILGAVLVGRDGLPVRVSLALLAVGVAALSTRYIEGRYRIRGPSRRSLRTLVAAVACSVAVAAASLAASGDLTSASGSEAPLPTLGPVTGARPPLPEPVLAGPLPSDLEPTLLQAHRDNGGVMKGGCATRREETAVRDCSFGDVSSATTVVLFGDSHAAMWMPAITSIGNQASWRVVPLIKPACTPVEVRVWRDELQREFRECDEWRALALARIRELRPAMVFVGSSRNYDVIDAEGRVVSSGTSDVWLEGLVNVLGRVRQASERVVLLGDTPYHPTDPLECLATNERIEACAVPRSSIVDGDYQELERAAALETGVQLVEPTDWLCQETTCPLVFDHYLVYRNPGHLTATIVTVLAPQLRWEIDHP
jgi:peptidoglycan/LPS O-acetylase OafA/YrhL